jgi:hypothetical protein
MNETTKRFPRTMHEAFNCDSDPISGPYGKQASLASICRSSFIVIIAGIILFWSRV